MKARKKTVEQVKIKPPNVKPGEYPFENPIIVSTDDFIIDGQHRFEVCRQYNTKIKYVKIDFTKEQLHTIECITKIQEIKKQQSHKLHQYFQKYNVGYKKQVTLCSSDDKIKYMFLYKDLLKSDQEYWQYLGEAYIQSSNNYKYRKELMVLFNASRAHKEFLMTVEERKFLLELPKEVTIYRAMTIHEKEGGDYGFSWTLDKQIAERRRTL